MNIFHYTRIRGHPKSELHKLKCVKINRSDITTKGIEDLLSVFNIDHKKSWSKTKKLGLLNARCN